MEKKKTNPFMKLLMILFIIFIGLFIAQESGYYEAKIADKVIFTEEAIQKFEDDVINNEVIDLKTYLNETKEDYSNAFTDAGEKVTKMVEKFITEGLGESLKVIKHLFS